MRYLRVSIFLAVILIATGVFLPFVQISVGGIAVSRAGSLTLYGAVSSYTFIERAAAKIEASPAERIADALLQKAGQGPLSSSSLVQDARSAVDDIKRARDQADLDTVGTILRTAGISFLVLLVIAVWLLLQRMTSKQPGPKRMVGVSVIVTIVAAISVALFFVVRESLRLGNEEIGASLLSLGSGAYLMLVGAAIGLPAAIAGAVFELRLARRASAPPPAAPPPSAV